MDVRHFCIVESQRHHSDDWSFFCGDQFLIQTPLQSATRGANRSPHVGCRWHGDVDVVVETTSGLGMMHFCGRDIEISTLRPEPIPEMVCEFFRGFRGGG